MIQCDCVAHVERGMREERLISRASAAGAAMDASFLVQKEKPPCLAARFSPPGSTAAAARPSPFSSRSCCCGLLRVCACLPPLRPVRPTQLSGRSGGPSSRSVGFGVGAGGAAPLSRSFCFSSSLPSLLFSPLVFLWRPPVLRRWERQPP